MRNEPRKLEHVNGHRIAMYGWFWWRELFVDNTLILGTFKDAVRNAQKDGCFPTERVTK